MSTIGDEVYEGVRCAVCEERFTADQSAIVYLPNTGERVHQSCWMQPNDGPGPDGHHLITGECFACMVGVATGPESHGDYCPHAEWRTEDWDSLR